MNYRNPTPDEIAELWKYWEDHGDYGSHVPMAPLSDGNRVVVAALVDLHRRIKAIEARLGPEAAPKAEEDR